MPQGPAPHDQRSGATLIFASLALVVMLGSRCGIGWMGVPEDGQQQPTDGDADADADADADSDPPPVDCQADCVAGHYNACTCGAADPCGWSGDGDCDDPCFDIDPTGHFDDSSDCDAPPLLCGGDCDARRHTACTCAPDDPCGWTDNGVCNDRCADVTASFFDDSEDCGPPVGELTFGVTAVHDNLDPSDMDLFARSIAGAGYREEIRDRNVSNATLAGYLRQDINTIYHTGHGLEGEVMTSDYALTTHTTTINARNVIFATCLTLQVSWAATFGATAESIMGYTEVSYDYVDDEAAQAFVDQLGRGRSHIEAWYLANSAIGMLADRWAGYVRTGSSIVEYSARTGRRPTALMAGPFVELGPAGGVFVAPSVLEDSRTYDTDYTSVAIVGGALHETSFDEAGLDALGPMSFGSAEALAAAVAWVESHGGMPVDAVIDRVIPILRRTAPGAAPETVGYTVRFVRAVAGLMVRSNLVEDHLSVTIGPRGVVATSRFWPDLVLDGGDDPFAGTTLEVGRATLLAADGISRARKGGGEVHLVEASPVYGTLGLNGGDGELLPAFELRTAEGGSIIVNALTGEPLL